MHKLHHLLLIVNGDLIPVEHINTHTSQDIYLSDNNINAIIHNKIVTHLYCYNNKKKSASLKLCPLLEGNHWSFLTRIIMSKVHPLHWAIMGYGILSKYPTCLGTIHCPEPQKCSSRIEQKLAVASNPHTLPQGKHSMATKLWDGSNHEAVH